MTDSWGQRIRRWFRRKPDAFGSFDPQAFEVLCQEDPEAARDALHRDQRELSDELEKTVIAYRERLDAFSRRIDGATDRNAEREFRQIRDAQDAIRRLLRRIDASHRESGELEEDLRAWEGRTGEEGVRHADHPDIRAEIIRSELAGRGRMPRLVAISLNESPFGVTEQEQEAEHVFVENGGSIAEENFSLDPDPDVLVASIRHITRDIERWHDAPEFHAEAIQDVTQLKQLHGVLKRLDRQKGIVRDRVSLAVRMRPID